MKFDHQLTDWMAEEDLHSFLAPLDKYQSKYEIKSKRDLKAIFTTGAEYVVDREHRLRSQYKKKNPKGIK